VPLIAVVVLLVSVFTSLIGSVTKQACKKETAQTAAAFALS
jgi:hypothetical protein